MKTTFSYLLLIIALLIISSCQKEPPKAIPIISTTAAFNITSTTATTGGTISSDGNTFVIVRGVCWSTSQSPTTSDFKTYDGSGIGNFTSNITLNPGVTYYARAYATNSVGTSYGNQITITATAILATISTKVATSITPTTATCGGNINNDGGVAVIARGVCWSTSQNPTIMDSKTTDNAGIGSFTSNVTGLNSGVTYYARAYATNNVGTAYGNQITITTTAILPTISTTVATSITTTTAISGGNINNDSGVAVIARGVCWSTSQNPTITDSNTTNGAGNGSFTSNITGLNPGITYYARAYATNNIGTAYGNQISFRSQEEIVTKIIATVSTNSLSNITATNVMAGGWVTSEGFTSVTERGVVYSTSFNPTISDTKKVFGNGKGSYIVQINNLIPNTSYYIRAYAINEIGIAYGGIINFRTLQQQIRSTVITNDICELTSNSAVAGGNVTSDGFSSVSERGIVYSNEANPTINSTKISSGKGLGSYISLLIDLTPNKTYYLRSYAINNIDISYGEQISFTTLEKDIQYPGSSLKSVKIGNVWWAPVNLGYDSGHKYGLLYQWHRKYGQGYDGEAPVPKVIEHSVDLLVGNDIINRNNFYISPPYGNNWCTTYYNIWDMSPEYNPCPSGWRVPTVKDFVSLNNSGSTWTDSGGDVNQPGRWYGYDHNSYRTFSVFLPASGNIWYDGTFHSREVIGLYWSNVNSFFIFRDYISAIFDRQSRVDGLSVRCVHD